MKTYKNLYAKLCSMENLMLAYHKARHGKSKKVSVIEFEKNLDRNMKDLQTELISLTYKPQELRRFIVRDPKTRTIHSSAFRDRVVHHAIINIIGPIFQKRFIYDSYASIINKGTHPAVQRFDYFKRKVSKNGRVIKSSTGGGAMPFKNNFVQGYCLKSDIRKYFDNVNHEVLINIIKKKISDERLIWLIKQILDNFETKQTGKGMPLGNYTSQFLANVYLNELDYFVKHIIKARYYIRYVDDFVILHKRKRWLEVQKERIDEFLRENLKIELHPDKSQIIPLRDGVTFVGYRIFYHHKLLRKRNTRKFLKSFEKRLKEYESDIISHKNLIEQLQGWFGYAKWANTHKFRKKLLARIEEIRLRKAYGVTTKLHQ